MIDSYAGSGEVRFEYRYLPVGGQESKRAAQAAECAAEQGRFWDYHDVLFENWAGENSGAYGDANLLRFASALGLETDSFDSCLGSGRSARAVEEDVRSAVTLGVRPVPTVLINNRRIEGLRSYVEYRSIIEDELSKAR